MVRKAIRQHPVDPSRIYVAGLSAGGAMTALMARNYPDLFAAAAIHAGLPPAAATSIPGAFSAMRRGAKGTLADHCGRALGDTAAAGQLVECQIVKHVHA